MTALRSALDETSAGYAANREAMLEKLAEIEAEHAKAIAGGGPKYTERHRGRGKLLARERIELLLDPDTPFLELSPLAAWGTEFAVGGSVVTGIGVVEGTECLISASDPTVRGGTSNPWTVRKSFRAHDIALANRLPVISLVESGGADLPTQKEIFIPGGRTFRDLTRLSAAGIPTIAIVFGNSTAGGAYLPGMSDHVVMISGRSKVFLGGPPLVKMATGEESDDESLGGADMHARTSGLADYLAADEHDAIRIGRRIVARLNWRKQGPGPVVTREAVALPLFDAEELIGIVPADLRIPFDPREVIARVVDSSDFDEFKPTYGTSLVTGWANVHGYPVGILANAQGVLFSAESQKAAQFIQLANQVDTPLIFLHNTTGYMVGQPVRAGRHHQARRDDDQRGIELGRAAHLGLAGRVLRRRALRHVRPRVRPPLPLRVAEREVGCDGPGPARGRPLDRVQGRRAGGWPAIRRGGRRRHEGHGRSADRGGVAADVPVRPDLRRRDHRPSRHPYGPWPVPVGHPRRRDSRHRRLRRVPDVIAMLTRVLVANRGEIARRVFRTCVDLGLATVAVYSDADAGAPHVADADAAVRLPGHASADTYLRADLLIEAALRAGADAVHPGYGFLSENAAFARAVQSAGLAWIGPPPAAIEAMGSKVASKRLMAAAGVPVLRELDPDTVTEADLPVLIKASAGGGGRGMRVVRTVAELPGELAAARSEAASAFGDPTVFCEPYIETGRHIEVQVLADEQGAVWTVGERECSIQRRHQKIIEEAPSPLVERLPGMRDQLFEAARAAVEAVGYRNAGTVEFLSDSDGRFYFLEMNTRLQVEHPVTECTTGLDLVALQLSIAAGLPLPAGAAARHRARDRGAAVRRGSGGGLAAAERHAAHVRVPGDARAVHDPRRAGSGRARCRGLGFGWTRASSVATRSASSTIRCWPRSSPWRPTGSRRPLAVGGPGAGPDPRRHDEPGPARPGAAAPGVHRGRHRHGLLRPAPLVTAGGLAAPLADDDAVRLSALAAALADAAARRVGARVLGGLPSGWRNVPSAFQRKAFERARGAPGLAHGQTIEIGYRIERNGLIVDGRDDVSLESMAADLVELTVAGIRHGFRVAAYPGLVCVDSALGPVSLRPVPRFKDAAAQAGPARFSRRCRARSRVSASASVSE